MLDKLAMAAAEELVSLRCAEILFQWCDVLRNISLRLCATAGTLKALGHEDASEESEAAAPEL